MSDVDLSLRFEPLVYFKNICVSNYLRLNKFLLIKKLLKRSVLILGIMKQ